MPLICRDCARRLVVGVGAARLERPYFGEYESFLLCFEKMFPAKRGVAGEAAPIDAIERCSLVAEVGRKLVLLWLAFLFPRIFRQSVA